MPSNPETWSLEKVAELPEGRTAMLVTASVAERARALPFQRVANLESFPATLKNLVVIGGGSLIDWAKVWRVHHSPETRLVAIPSLWGSGAEVSPVAVLDSSDGGKEIYIGREFLPDVCCVWPELADSLPERVARHGCGDAWSHALEGFLSPLADSELRSELAALINEMLTVPLANDPHWFELSARACAAQARSGVGLVHGIAHTLEGPLRKAHPEAGWGHAWLCSIFLWPVMAFNRNQSNKWDELASEYGLDRPAIFRTLQRLHEPDPYTQTLPLLDALWKTVLRDPCTRANSVLVRPPAKNYFLQQRFQ